MRIFISFLLLVNFALSANLDEIYPKAESGEVRRVLNLPKLENGDKYLVLVEFGKNIKVDSCNIHSFSGGKLEKFLVDGWGYEYYKFSSPGDIISTMMLCEDKKKIEKFVKSQANLYLKYSSKSELVFYTPKEVEIKYSIFELNRSEFIK